MAPPTIAVVIAAYQAADTIADAVESVLAQTRQADELIVCDDGSTDHTAAVLAPYRGRITVITQENSGAAAATNAAARAARSDFVAILDADDVYAPERLEAMSQLALARPDLDLITTDVVAEIKGQPIGYQSDLRPFPAGADEQRAEILRHSFLSCPAIRRNRLLAVGGFDESLRSAYDWDCWIRLILDGALVGYVDEPLYVYRLGGQSLASDPLTNRRMNVAVLEKLLLDPRLQPNEREGVRAGIRNQERIRLLLELKEAVATGDAAARRIGLRVALGRGFAPASRLKATLSVVAPALSRWLLERRSVVDQAVGVDLAER